MSENVLKFRQENASESNLSTKDIAWDSKHTLKNSMNSLLNDEKFRQMPLEYRERLKKELEAVLKRKDINEKSLKEEYRRMREELAKEIREVWKRKANERTGGDKLSNITSEAQINIQIKLEALKWNECILDYDSKKWNQMKSVKDFEKELSDKPIEQINIRWLANYIIFLKWKWQLSQFFGKLWDWNKEMASSLFYNSITYNESSLSWVIDILNKEWYLGVVNELKNLSEKEILKGFQFINTINYIFIQHKDKIWQDKKEQFTRRMLACKNNKDLLTVFSSFGIISNEKELMKIFENVTEDFQKCWIKMSKELASYELNRWTIINENSTLDMCINSSKLANIPNNFHKKQLSELTNKDWLALEKVGIFAILRVDIAIFFEKIREKKKNVLDTIQANNIAKDQETRWMICRVSSWIVNEKTRWDYFDKALNIVTEKWEQAALIKEKIQIINKIPWFEDIKDEYELLNNPNKLDQIIEYLSNKKDRTKDEELLYKYLVTYYKTKNKVNNLDKKIDKERENESIQDQIQTELLKVIQSIPWYSNVTDVWDIIYDSYALDWAIKYLNSKRTRTKTEQLALNKLIKLRSNLWDIKKIDKEITKNNIGNNKESFLSSSSETKKMDDYIKSSNNFDLWKLPQDFESRQMFFDALFRNIDNNWDSIKHIKSRSWVMFNLSKDWDKLYKVSYWDREIKWLSRKELRNSISFANLLAPLWLMDLVPYSTRIINEINKKSNGKPINDLDGMSDEEKKLCFTKLWQAILPWFQDKPELEENEKQFKDMNKVNANIKSQKEFQYNWKISSISQLLKLKFPSSDTTTFDIISLLKSIPN